MPTLICDSSTPFSAVASQPSEFLRPDYLNRFLQSHLIRDVVKQELLAKHNITARIIPTGELDPKTGLPILSGVDLAGKITDPVYIDVRLPDEINVPEGYGFPLDLPVPDTLKVRVRPRDAQPAH